jgi:ligand-binding SRPBCC domain-containing protein
MYVLKATQLVPAQRDEVFEFFSRPENLGRITPQWLSFRIMTPSPVPMRQGAVIDYRIGLGGVPTRWRSIISTHEPPERFVDEQLRGPYDYWHHTHEFERTPEGTLLRDRVVYAPPLGILGRLAHAILIRRQLERIFTHRHQVIGERFGHVAGRPPALDFSRTD